MYRLIMCVPNISHLSWWWKGQSVYRFDSLMSLFAFMNCRIPSMRKRDFDLMLERDAAGKTGRLACTSWYEVKKGEDEMTEYTSL